MSLSLSLSHTYIHTRTVIPYLIRYTESPPRFFTAGLSLNQTKCAFGGTSGALLGCIVSNEGIAMDLRKIKAIIKAPTPKNTKALNRFLGQIRWHNWMLQYLADFATPLHASVHKTPFKWTEIEEDAYNALKIMLTQAPVVQPPVWT